MSNGKYTKDFFKDVRRDLSGIAGKLDRLIGLADRPQKDAEQRKGPAGAPAEAEYAAVGRVFVAAYGHPPERPTEKSKKKWYRNPQWWNKFLKVAGIIFGIIYAIVTVFQWRDLRHNFFIEQKSWAKYQILWPTDPTADSKVEMNITNTGKIPMLSSFVLATIEVIPKDKPALLSDGTHGADGEYHSFLFPNDNFIHAVGPHDDKTGAARGFTDEELSDLRELLYRYIRFHKIHGRTWQALAAILRLA